MSFNYLVHFSREAELKYIGHLDMMRLWQRILKRTGLPIAYSQGFNPHLKFSLAKPLSVGMTSSAEYLELTLDKIVKPQEIMMQIQNFLPLGISLREIRLSPYKENLGAKIALIEYQVTVNKFKTTPEEISKAVANFNSAETINYSKTNKSGTKEINLKSYVKALEIKENTDNSLLLYMQLKVTALGTVKPEDVLAALNIKYEYLLLHRQAVYFVTSKGEYYLP